MELVEPLREEDGPPPNSNSKEEDSTALLTTTTTPRKLALRVLLPILLVGLWFAITEVFTRPRLVETSHQVESVAIKPTPSLPTSFSSAKNESAKNWLPAPENVEEKHYTTATSISPRDRLVLSMKTMPSRIAYIQPTLDSLLFHQKNLSNKPDKFYLALPKQPVDGPQYTIPKFLQKYIDQGYITILQPSYDYGAIDKMIHTVQVEYQIYLEQKQEAEKKNGQIQQAQQFRILYLDDDMIYDPSFVKILSDKSEEYPDCAVALSGAKLRSHFRQIGHTDPRKDHHPYLFYRVGGIDSAGDQIVDIVQGFMGVLVRLSFFNVTEFVSMAANKSTPGAVRRSDDFAICGYLEYRGVRRRCVDGGLKPVLNAVAARTDNLGRSMNRNAMGAASYLQAQWGIWKNYTFCDFDHLPESTQRLIDCEARRTQFCPPSVIQDDPSATRQTVTKLLDQLLNVSLRR